MSDDKLTRPDLSIRIKQDDGKYKEIHMSYGLFNDLQRVCPDPAIVLEAGLSDPLARDFIIRRCFMDTKKTIISEDEMIGAEDIPINDPEELEKLLTWVSGHLLYFFSRTAEGLKKLGETFQKLIPQAPADQSNSGSED